MKDDGIGLHAPEHRRVNRVVLKAGAVAESFRPDPRLVHHVHLSDHAIQICFLLVLHAMLLEVGEDVGLHLRFRRAHEEHLHAFELGQEIRERTGGSSLIQFSNQGDAKAVERALAVNGVQVEQGLRGMLPAIAIARIDDWHGRDLGRP